MPESETIRLQLVTPLWTGGVDGTSDAARTTGMVGSLRWWHEAIQRAFGHHCCDPSNHVPGSPHRACDASAIPCTSCQTYGATGLRRSWRIELSGGTPFGFTKNLNVKPRGDQQNRGWYLGPGITGQVTFRIVALRRDADAGAVVLPLMLAAEWSGLGARTQIGYGVVRCDDRLEVPHLPDSLDRWDSGDLPNLRDMFFAKIRFDVARSDWWKRVSGLAKLNGRVEEWVASGSVPIAPAIKDWLRFGNSDRSPIQGIPERHHADFLFGKVQGDDRVRSRLCISCAYPLVSPSWEFRVWGWLPRNSPNGMNRDQVLSSLKDVLSGNDWQGRLGNQAQNIRSPVWREFDSERDTVARRLDIREYLTGLLSRDEGVVPSSGGRS